VIDAPGIPEKKSFPPRLLLALLTSVCSVAMVCFLLLVQEQWRQIHASDPRKLLGLEIGHSLRHWRLVCLPRMRVAR